MHTVKDIREMFAKKLDMDKPSIDLIGASFIADEPSIFGKVNYDYVMREIAWYISQSLSVNSIAGNCPEIWKLVSSDSGFINSNYGFLVFSEKNGSQFKNVINQLLKSQSTRRGTMVYTRPQIHKEYNKNGMQDFICTNAVNYMISDNKLNAVIQMRSNDAVFGYKNDYAWQDFMMNLIISTLASKGVHLDKGDMVWQVANLHVYKRHFNLISNYINGVE